MFLSTSKSDGFTLTLMYYDKGFVEDEFYTTTLSTKIFYSGITGVSFCFWEISRPHKHYFGFQLKQKKIQAVLSVILHVCLLGGRHVLSP